jgi:hypothetical protein
MTNSNALLVVLQTTLSSSSRGYLTDHPFMLYLATAPVRGCCAYDDSTVALERINTSFDSFDSACLFPSLLARSENRCKHWLAGNFVVGIPRRMLLTIRNPPCYAYFHVVLLLVLKSIVATNTNTNKSTIIIVVVLVSAFYISSTSTSTLHTPISISTSTRLIQQ